MNVTIDPNGRNPNPRSDIATGDAGGAAGVTAAFIAAQRRVLERYEVPAESSFVDVPAISGRAHVLVCGDGPPLVLVIGGTVPAAMWAPLMGQLQGYRLFAMDLPGFGLTDAIDYETSTLRRVTTGFLADVLDGLGIERARFITNSQGALWTTWLSLDTPRRVEAQVQVGCPAHVLGTTAPLPMRIMSLPGAGRLLARLSPPSTEQVEQVGRMVGEDFSSIPELRDVLLACERLPDYQRSMAALMSAVMRLGRARPEVVLDERSLAGIGHPVQMIWGADDPFGSLNVARRIASSIPDAELHMVEGGHAPWFLDAPKIARLARGFLEAHDASAR